MKIKHLTTVCFIVASNVINEFCVSALFFPSPAVSMSSSKFYRMSLSSIRYDLWRRKPISGNTSLRLSTNSSNQKHAASKKKKDKSLFRADRVLSNRGWGSRSECFDLLKKKRVFEQSDSGMKCITGPKQKISMDAELFVDGKKVPKLPPLLRMYHKPKWVLSVMSDSKNRPNLGDLDEKMTTMMHPVGRLDYDSSGLLLFSSDGKLTQKLLHPSGQVEKEYAAVVAGKVNENDLREKLSQGVETSDGVFPGVLIKSTCITENEVKSIIDEIIDNLPPEYDLDKLEKNGHLFFKNASELSEVRLVVEEGKHRMVRRMLANCGHPVIKLKRYRLGPIQLHDDLLPGCWRELTPEEDIWAQQLLKKKNAD